MHVICMYMYIFLFCSLVKNEGFLKFSTTKIAKQNKEKRELETRDSYRKPCFFLFL